MKLDARTELVESLADTAASMATIGQLKTAVYRELGGVEALAKLVCETIRFAAETREEKGRVRELMGLFQFMSKLTLDAEKQALLNLESMSLQQLRELEIQQQQVLLVELAKNHPALASQLASQIREQQDEAQQQVLPEHRVVDPLEATNEQ